MCGVLFSAVHVGSDPQNAFELSKLNIYQDLIQSNTRRGPDAQASISFTLEEELCLPKSGISNSGGSCIYLDFFASELQLRGSVTVIQPHTDGRGNILCWNGEIFDGLGITSEENDGVMLLTELSALGNIIEVPEVLGRLEGPYAFVFYHKPSNCVIFARDPLGRRSLLLRKPTERNPILFVASVSTGGEIGEGFEDVSTDVFHVLDLDKWLKNRDFPECLTTVPRCAVGERTKFAQMCQVNPQLPPADYEQVVSLDEPPPLYLSDAVDNLIFHLDYSTMLRLQNIPRTLEKDDHARVAVLFSGGIDSTVIAYLAHRHIPISEPIDLLNVAFENPRKLRLATESSIIELHKYQNKGRPKKGQLNQYKIPDYRVPDRLTGHEEMEELRRLCPARKWNFVEVDVSYEEACSLRDEVRAIMRPCQTVMDLSLAQALYFASRGIGHIRDNLDAEPIPYSSTARVVLSGLGSDELLGGYGRHRAVYTNGGWKAVVKELQLELDRLPSRNLGRDDRIIACHGKETRHPFLSLTFLNYIASLPVHYKLDPRLGLGLGDKLLLRLATRKLGLIEASSRKKKAMQFGSQSARMEGEKRGDINL